MKKIGVTFLLILVVLSLILVIGRDQILKAAVETGAKIATGLDLKIGKLHVGLRSTAVDIQGLLLSNPAGFPDRIMLDLPRIFVDAHLRSLVKGKIRLTDMKIDLKQFTVVKNEKGQLNLDALKPVQTAKPGAKAEPKKKGPVPQLQIDNLELKIGKVVYKDYSKGGAPAVTEFNINLNEKFQNITNPNALVRLIVYKAMASSTIATLANFDLDGLGGTLTGTLGTSMKMAGAVGTKTVDTLKQTAQEATKVTEVASKTTDTLKQTAEGAGKITGEVAGTAKKATEDLASAAKGLTSSLFGKSSTEEKTADNTGK